MIKENITKRNPFHKKTIVMGTAALLDYLGVIVDNIKNRTLSNFLNIIVQLLHSLWIGIFMCFLFTGFGILPLIFCIIKGKIIWSIIIALIGYDAYAEFTKHP